MTRWGRDPAQIDRDIAIALAHPDYRDRPFFAAYRDFGAKGGSGCERIGDSMRETIDLDNCVECGARTKPAGDCAIVCPDCGAEYYA